ncbi:hypothetical protein [Dermacoccus barathri]|uniref:Uncharacterized protein n=1 Tax=Dermacoccus abyssi TaxID=322596 RepID=A0ABX5Z5K6_9MICO|nr:hypothetical protein [Dermacoccus barathri]MBE7372791.1 hypothetical protein [Dermacoccus barathri]QEH92119.1 hypothetical protein FV141_00110 [Dermacoccus abyssi]
MMLSRKPLGTIGTCGNLNGIASTPVCLIRLENGSNLTFNGDYTSQIDEVGAFTTGCLANAKTR